MSKGLGGNTASLLLHIHRYHMKSPESARGYCWLTLQFPSFLAVFYSDHRSSSFFFFAHAPLSFYVIQHEGTSLLGKGDVCMNISVSAWTLNAKVIYI